MFRKKKKGGGDGGRDPSVGRDNGVNWQGIKLRGCDIGLSRKNDVFSLVSILGNHRRVTNPYFGSGH